MGLEPNYIIVDGLPLGATPFGIAIEALRRVCDLKQESDTEVWGSYFTRPGLFDVRLLQAASEDRRPDLRMTLDYPEDYEFFRRVYLALSPSDSSPSLRDIIRYCDAHPEVAAINRDAQDRYERHLEKATPARMRTS